MKREYINFYKEGSNDFFMVKIVDVTTQRREKKRDERLERELAEQCFEGREVKFLGENFMIQISDKERTLAEKMFGTPKMTVYDSCIIPQVDKFAMRYQTQFNQNDFVIELDYSENP